MQRCLLFLAVASFLLVACGTTSTSIVPTAQAPSVAPPSVQNEAQMTDDYVTFSINVQDFGHPAESAATLHRIIDLHEQYDLPVDIYLTGQMAEIYATQFPDLVSLLKSSSVVSISYHVRPPAPYFHDFDWMNLTEMSPQEQYETILRYETHATDPVSGQTTEALGGYAGVSELIKYPPYSAGALAEAGLDKHVMSVFRELGAQFTVVHGRTNNLGDTKEDLYIKPEHYDYKLFEFVGQDAAASFEAALLQAHTTQNARAPYFIGVKMHDNDFIATRSSWLTVYMDQSRRPPWDPTLQAPMLSVEEQAAMWNIYEQTVAYVASQQSRVRVVNLPMVLEMIP